METGVGIRCASLRWRGDSAKTLRVVHCGLLCADKQLADSSNLECTCVSRLMVELRTKPEEIMALSSTHDQNANLIYQLTRAHMH